MFNRLTAQGIRLGIAVLLASFAGQALAGIYAYDGVATTCLPITCDVFAALEVDAELSGAFEIDVEASGSFTFGDVASFSFLVTSSAALIPYDGTNPTTANPLPIDSSVAILRAQNMAGTIVTGGTTNADGELDSGTLLFEFYAPPFNTNGKWLVLDVGTGQAKVCQLFDAIGCMPGVSETVVFDGSFQLQQSLKVYAQDFETLDIGDPDALINDNWLVFGNVSDSAGNFLFGYGPFGAPNGGPGFSAIDTGQGGAAQGLQQLSIYNDYNCCQPSNGHFNGTDLVESNVFQEQTIGLENVGERWKFSFDAKLGNLVNPSTALAFIKTLDPDAGFATTNFITVDMTPIGSEWMRYYLSITIDAGLVGQFLQFGGTSTASNFVSSGIFYDNIDFSIDIDADNDGVLDAVDNCTLVANADQRDTDGDNIGNICDADVFNPGANDCFVNFLDLNVYRANFFMPGDLDTDNDGDSFTNFVDLNIVRDFFFQPPGPSAAGCN